MAKSKKATKVKKPQSRNPPAKPARTPHTKSVKPAAAKAPAGKSPTRTKIDTGARPAPELAKLLYKGIEPTDAADALWHKAAQILKRNTGFTLLNLVHGKGKQMRLVAAHENDASYLADPDDDFKFNALPADPIEKGTFKLFRLLGKQPEPASLTGCMLCVQIPLFSGAIANLVLASADPAPSYTRSDLITVQDFSKTLIPLLAAFELAETHAQSKKSAGEFQSRIQSLKQDLDSIEESEKSKRSDMETELARLKGERSAIESSLQSATSENTALKSSLVELREKSDSEKKATREKLSAISDQLEKSRTETADAIRQAVAPLNERISALEKERQELEQAGEDLGRELSTEKKTIESLRAELLELESRRSHLEQDLVRAGSEHGAEVERLKSEKTRIASDLDAIQKNSSSASQQLMTRIDELEKHLTAEIEKHKKEISFQEARNREVSSHLDDERKKFTTAEKNAAEEKSTLQKHISEKDQKLSQLGQDHEGFVKKLRAEHQDQLEKSQRELTAQAAALKTEITQKGSEIAGLKESLQQQSRKLEEESQRNGTLTRALDEAKQTIESAQSQVKSLADKSNRLSEQLEQARKETYRAQEERTGAQKQIKSLEELLLGRDRELKQKTEESNRREEANQKLKSEQELARKEKQSLEETQTALRKELGHFREREYRLEQDVLSLEEQKRTLSGKIESLSEQIARLNNTIQNLNAEKDAVTGELAAVRTREKKLADELQSALSKERGSREEGIILSNFAFALSAVAGFSGKLDALRSGLAARMKLKRVFAYSVSGERLQLIAGALANGWLPGIAGKTFNLKQTTAGTALATLKPDVRKSSVPEIPEEILTELLGQRMEEKSIAILPLIDSNETVGLLAIGSDGVIPEPEVRLLSSLAPLIAVSLRQEIEAQARSSVAQTLKRKQSIIRYLESRLHHRGFEIDPDRSPEEILASFEAWTHGLARELAEHKIHSELMIDSNCLLALTDVIEDPVQLYYITREAVDNTKRHAEASRLTIRLDRSEKGIRLVIEDNGEGLLRKAGSENPERGHGLAAIKDMARDSGAECKMSKGPEGTGLRIECLWHSGPG